MMPSDSQAHLSLSVNTIMIFSNDQAVPNRCILAGYRLSDY